MKKIIIYTLFSLFSLFLISGNATAAYYLNDISIPAYQQLYQTPGLTNQQKEALDRVWNSYAYPIKSSNDKIVSYTRQYQQLNGLANKDPEAAKAAKSVKNMLDFEVANKNLMYDKMIKAGKRIVEKQ